MGGLQNARNIFNHVLQGILHPKGLVLIGATIVVVGGVTAAVVLHKSSPLSPTSGPEGTEVTLSYPKLKNPPAQATVTFSDAGEHGYYAVNDGAGSYVAYDPTRGLSYTTTAASAPSDKKHTNYKAVVPSGICGLIIQSSQAKAEPPKSLAVSLTGPDGKPVAGTKSATFKLKCDKYTMSVKIKSSKDPVLPDGVDQSTITATLSVKGPAQFVNGVRVKPSDPKITLVSPLGFVITNFSTSLGALVPTPSNVKTARDGTATVTITSADAGIAKVRATALGIGDASVNVHFKPKITGVTEIFVQPNSPTNYQIATIPANGKDLTYDWEIIRPAGAACGSLTGAASGLGEATNGFFHGPTKEFPDGCDQKYEFATQIKVTVTDKDGQSDTKTFSARAFEGKGPTALP